VALQKSSVKQFTVLEIFGLSLTLANFEQAHRPRGMRNIGSLSTIS
jgi:hypothetical protein